MAARTITRQKNPVGSREINMVVCDYHGISLQVFNYNSLDSWNYS